MLNHHNEYKAGLLLLLIGAVFILQNVFSFNVINLWPVLIILVGVSMLFRSSYFADLSLAKDETSEDELHNAVVFGSLERRYSTKNFKGGKLRALFGSALIDLSKVTIPEGGAELDLSAIFGNIEVIVPSNIQIKSVGSGIIGSFSNEVAHIDKIEGGVLLITGIAVLGSVEVKN